MEDIKRALTVGQSSATVLGAVSKLRSLILGPGTSSNDQEEGLGLVWSSLGSQHVLSAQACGDLLADLVEVGKLEPGSTITQLLASLSHGMEFTGIIPALGQILVQQAELNIQSNDGIFKGQHAISSNQHPFISVLRSTPSTWPLVLDQCLTILTHHKSDIRSNCLPILRPVLLYLFCDPNHHDHFGSMRSSLIRRLLKMATTEDVVFTFLAILSCWQKIDIKTSLPEVTQFTLLIFDLAVKLDQTDFITKNVFRLASLVQSQVKYGFSPIRTLEMLNMIMDLGLITNWDVGLLVLDKALQISSHIHHPLLLSVCLKMIKEGWTTQLPSSVIVATCLQSLALPNQGFDKKSSALKAELVRSFYKLDWTERTEDKSSGHTFDLPSRSARQLVHLMYFLSDPTDWLDTMSSMTHRHLVRSLPVLTALFLCSHCASTVKTSLQLMLDCVASQSDLSSSVLTLLLHKLSSPIPDPEVKLALLHALPSMSGDKACISLVIKLVGSLASRPGLAPLKLSLLAKLWRVEGRCYPFLQKALQEPVPQAGAVEYRITQAAVIRDIVSTHGSQYGSDLLPILSGILNQCGSEEATSAAVIALEGILTLVKEGVIDMQTTIKVLAPKCSKDSRPLVTVGYISLLGLAPTFRVSGAEYLKFLSNSLAWLWAKVSDKSVNPQVLEAAYQAIAKFPLESTTLKMLPVESRSELKLPPRYCATPAEAARRPEDVLPYVPAEVWPRLLVSGHETGVECLLTSLAREEVTGLPRAVYHLSTAMQNSGTEPVSYSHLPEQSVLRGVVGSLQTAASNRKELPRHLAQLQTEAKSLAIMMRVLSSDHGRLLPPLDWSFLEPFFHDSNLRSEVISLLSRQSDGSRSARTLVERQIGSEQARDTVMSYMSNIGLLVPSVNPQILGPFLHRSLSAGVSSPADLRDMFKYLQNVLDNPNLLPEVSQIIGQAIEVLDDKIPSEHEKLFQDYLSVVRRLPLKTIERLSSPAVWWEITPAKLYRASCLRTNLACSDTTDTPLTWLNELVEVASKQTADYTFLFRSLMTVITKCRSSQAGITTAVSWLLELMGQVGALVRKNTDNTSLPFLLDVFCLSVCLLTETDNLLVPRDQLCVSRATRQSLLPLSVCRLAIQQPMMAGQLAEWSLQLVRGDKLNPHHRDSLMTCLPVFKYAPNWSEASMWGRIVLAL